MWQCVECQSEVEDNFEICWNCGTSSDGILDPEFRRAVDDADADEDSSDDSETDEPSSHSCLRCEVPLYYRGATPLHVERDQYSIIGDAFQAMGIPVYREWLYLYVCQQCGHVEFFAKRQPDRDDSD